MGFVATWDEHLARDREPVRDVEQPGISNGGDLNFDDFLSLMRKIFGLTFLG